MRMLSGTVLGGVVASFVLMMAHDAHAGELSDWIESHPKLAESIKWQHRNFGYDVDESDKRPFPAWPAADKQALEDAYAAAEAWLAGADPFNDLNETITHEPLNLCEAGQSGTGQAQTCVEPAYAFELYVRWVAQILLTEREAHFPWSLLDYRTDELEALLDSSSMMSRIGTGNYELGTSRPSHPNYTRMKSNVGSTLPAPPRYTYAFLQQQGLIGQTPRETILRVLEWSTQMAHFFGSLTYDGADAHWQYRGLPPLSRIVEGTEFQGQLEHWTAGCDGTSGFLKNVLRAANIPVGIRIMCGHSLPHFPTEQAYLDHADNLYNSNFTNSSLDVEALLIDEQACRNRFGSTQLNVTSEAECLSDGVGRTTRIIAGEVEDCADGEDNTADGLVDCEDPTCVEVSYPVRDKLIPEDAKEGDVFGESLDVSGETVVVGASAAASLGTGSEYTGAAYVYRLADGGGYQQLAKLVASDAGPDPGQSYLFGTGVAIAGNTAIVRGYVHGEFGGYAYVFVEQADGSWLESQVLQPSDGQYFSARLSMSEEYAVLGSVDRSDDLSAAYVYENVGGQWVQGSMLSKPDDVHFGAASTVWQDRIAISAHGENDDRGAVHLYRRSAAGVWEPETVLAPPDLQPGDGFGVGLHLEGDLLIAGAQGRSNKAGAAYIYRRDGAGTWHLEETLLPLAPSFGGFFGSTVAVGSNRAMVGEPRYDDARGRVAVYQFDGASWLEEEPIEAYDGVDLDQFGWQLALSGSNLVITATGDNAEGPYTGAVYVNGLNSSRLGQCMTFELKINDGPPRVRIRYSLITKSGETQLTASASGPALPAGYVPSVPTQYYDVTTSAAYSGPVQVCVDHSDLQFAAGAEPTLLAFDGTSWLDVCGTSGCSQGQTATEICGSLDLLQQVVVADTAPPWTSGQHYAVGDRVTFNGVIYQARQAHTALPGWQPPDVLALWMRPTPPNGQPWTSNTNYPLGSVATFGGESWRVIQGHVSQSNWSPPNVPALWVRGN